MGVDWVEIGADINQAVGQLVGKRAGPDIPERLPAPGVFYRHYGARDVVPFCLGHLVFGAAAGSTYGFLHATLTRGAII